VKLSLFQEPPIFKLVSSTISSNIQNRFYFFKILVLQNSESTIAKCTGLLQNSKNRE